MNKPLVSVIIPVYNASRYLAACIDSVIAQTWPAIEVIIVNDGSTDNSLEIANRYASDKIKVISKPKGGASSARNRGIQASNGEYIQFLDADDFLGIDKIEKQVEALRTHPGYVAVCSTVHFKDDEDAQKNAPSAYEEEFLIDADPVEFIINLWGGYSSRGSMIQPNAWLTHRNLIEKAGPWNENLSLDDDGEFFCRVILASSGVIKTKGINYYRKHTSQLNLSAITEYQSRKSHLHSAISKKNNLLKHTDKKQAVEALYKMFMDIAVATYRHYPDIYKEAIKECPPFKPGGYYVELGGPLANTLGRIIGWKPVVILQRIYSKIRNG